MRHPVNHMDIGNCERYDWNLPSKYKIVWESSGKDGAKTLGKDLVVKKRFGKYYAAEYIPVFSGLFSSNDIACYIIDSQECQTIEAAKERYKAWKRKQSQDREEMVSQSLRDSFKAKGDSIQGFAELLKKDPNWTNVIYTSTYSNRGSAPTIKAWRTNSDIYLEITHIGSILSFELTLPPLSPSAYYQASYQEIIDIGNAAVSNKKVSVTDKSTIPFKPILCIAMKRDECDDDRFMSTIDTLIANALNVAAAYQRKGLLPNK